MNQSERARVVISNVWPELNCGHFPIKRVIGEEVTVTADIFADGHSRVYAQLLFKHKDQSDWNKVPMNLINNDRWKGQFQVGSLGTYFYTIEAWVDYFFTWQEELQKKYDAQADVAVELQIGIQFLEEILKNQENPLIREKLVKLKESNNLEQSVILALDKGLHALVEEFYPNKRWVTQYSKELYVTVDPLKAQFSSWYEMFPRSASPEPNKHGTFKDCEKLLPRIAKLGFDILYLPPIHPIGVTKRRGKNSQLGTIAGEAPGSPWAIGSKDGGHKSIHSQLGSLEDFQALVQSAKKHGIDVALDIAFQASPDHPYVKEHPSWFKHRPDGTIQFAENPPKKYEDIVPFYFESDEWKELWEKLKSIILFWIEKGITIFRVDNPHTKPFIFWEHLIQEIKQQFPEVIFLSEAFTRPKVMYWLSKLGFSQSYTYFSWRQTKRELTEYLSEITSPELKEFFRPNLWPNTPDILPEILQYGGQGAYAMRFILAATLAPSFGIYGPVFELMVNEAFPGKEEYLNAEKYEIKHWDRQDNDLTSLMAKVNQIRKENKALQSNGIHFLSVDNEQIIFYARYSSNSKETLLIAVNLDPFNAQKGKIKIPLHALGLPQKDSYRVQELLQERRYIWEGDTQEINLDPKVLPANIFKINKKVRREEDFEYFT